MVIFLSGSVPRAKSRGKGRFVYVFRDNSSRITRLAEVSCRKVALKDINLLGSWAFTANDIPLAIDMLDRARDRYPWDRIQTCFPFTEDGIMDAVESAMAMRSVKATIVPNEGIG